MRGVQHGGFGVQIRSAGDAYFDLIEEVATPVDTVLRSDIVLNAGEDDTRSRFRARVRQRGKSRSKVVFVACDTVSQARERALENAGPGSWELIEVEEL